MTDDRISMYIVVSFRIWSVTPYRNAQRNTHVNNFTYMADFLPNFITANFFLKAQR